MEAKKEDVEVGDIADGMYVIGICDNLFMCEGITPFDRGEEDEEEGCLVDTQEEIEAWEKKYENDWIEDASE